MPRCKYCSASLTRLDKNICPFCGGKEPLDGDASLTLDVTKVLDKVNVVDAPIKKKSRIIIAILAIIFGFCGGHAFYLRKIKLGIIYSLITIFLLGLSLILYFFTPLTIWAFLIPYLVYEIYFIIVAIYYLVKKDLVDIHGVPLK